MCKNINSADILVTYNPFSTLDIRGMKNLKYIQTSSEGIDQIPKDIAIEKNILIANNKGGYSIPMGEWIVMSILEIYKNSFNLYKQQLNNKWRMSFSTTELTGKRIWFIGTGTIPATKDTIGIINKEKFSIMKDRSIFINVGRGNIVNEEDLIDNIQKFRGVALDVFQIEPLSKESPLWKFDNVIITPHNSWVSDKNKDRTFDMIYNNLKNYIANKPLNNIVDINKGY